MAAKKKKAAPKVHYIVTYDLGGGDPVEVFTDLDQAKKFVTALLTKNQGEAESFGDNFSNSGHDVMDVDDGTIRVYEGTLIGKPKVEVLFTK